VHDNKGAERGKKTKGAPDDVPVTTASFLSPNCALLAAAFCMLWRDGNLKPASASKPSALPMRQADATRRRLAEGMLVDSLV